MYLGRVLRELREAAQMSTSEVCARIEFSPARLSRLAGHRGGEGTAGSVNQ
jgi:transcriptional regulator with XRE-family HTH domain